MFGFIKKVFFTGLTILSNVNFVSCNSTKTYFNEQLIM